VNDVVEHLKDWAPPALLVGGWILVALHHESLGDEIDRNEKHAAPDDRQIRWHIRHLRQDVALLCKLVMALIALPAWALLR